MNSSSFHILSLTLEDTDFEDPLILQLLVYVNGVLDTQMSFKANKQTTIFIHENDQITLELMRSNKSMGESILVLGDNELRWINFGRKGPMVLLRMELTQIGKEFQPENYRLKQKITIPIMSARQQNHHHQHLGPTQSQSQSLSRSPTKQSSSPAHCELCKGKSRKSSSTAQTSKLQDFNDLVGSIQTELRKMKGLLKTDLDAKQSKMVRKMILETQKINEILQEQRKHWCRHCVCAHKQEYIDRFIEIRRLVNSMTHHLDDQQFYHIHSKSHLLKSDSINDRGSPVRYSPQSKKISQSGNSNISHHTNGDFILQRIIERLQMSTNTSYGNLNQLEAIEILVEDIIKQNETLKSENRMINDLLADMQGNHSLVRGSENVLSQSIRQYDNNMNVSELKELFQQRERVISELMDKYAANTE